MANEWVDEGVVEFLSVRELGWNIFASLQQLGSTKTGCARLNSKATSGSPSRHI